MSQYFRRTLVALSRSLLAATPAASAGNTATLTDPAGDVTGHPGHRLGHRDLDGSVDSHDPRRSSRARPLLGTASVLAAARLRRLPRDGSPRRRRRLLVRARARQCLVPGRALGRVGLHRRTARPPPRSSPGARSRSGSTFASSRGRGPVFRLDAETYDDTHQDQAPGLAGVLPLRDPLSSQHFSPAQPVAGRRFAVLDPGSSRCRGEHPRAGTSPDSPVCVADSEAAGAKRLTVSSARLATRSAYAGPEPP